MFVYRFTQILLSVIRLIDGQKKFRLIYLRKCVSSVVDTACGYIYYCLILDIRFYYSQRVWK